MSLSKKPVVGRPKCLPKNLKLTRSFKSIIPFSRSGPHCTTSSKVSRN